jgi:hypothetical protein
MRQKQQVVHEQSQVMYAHAPRLKIVGEDESQFGFPLTYQILFLSITKSPLSL